MKESLHFILISLVIYYFSELAFPRFEKFDLKITAKQFYLEDGLFVSKQILMVNDSLLFYIKV